MQNTGADLSPVAELTAEVHAVAQCADPVLGNLPQTRVVEREVARTELCMRHEEEILGRLLERQVDLRLDMRINPHLQIPDPFTARRGDLGQHDARTGVVGGVALEIILQAQPEAHVVGAPRVPLCSHIEAVLTVVLYQSIVEKLEIAAAIELRDAPFDLRCIEGRPHQLVEDRLQIGNVTVWCGLDMHELDARRWTAHAVATGDVPRIRLGTDGEAAQLICGSARGLRPERNRSRNDSKVERGGITQLRAHDDVLRRERRELSLRIPSDQYREHLIGDRRRGPEPLARIEWEPHVDHDQHVHVHRAGHIDRQILRDATIDQDAAFTLDGTEDAGAERLARIAELRSPPCITTGSPLARSVATARNGVGRSSELVDLCHGQGQPSQHHGESLAFDQALGQLDLAAADPERKLHQEIPILLLAPKAPLGAGRSVAERLLPVHRAHHSLDLACAQAARVESADHGSHAGACNRIDRDMQLFEHLEHTDMRSATRSAS